MFVPPFLISTVAGTPQQMTVGASPLRCTSSSRSQTGPALPDLLEAEDAKAAAAKALKITIRPHVYEAKTTLRSQMPACWILSNAN